MIVNVLLPLVIAFIMFSLGLGLGVADFRRVMKFPRAFAVGLLNQVILLPLIAFGLAHVFGLSPVFAVGLMILAVVGILVALLLPSGKTITKEEDRMSDVGSDGEAGHSASSSD